MDRIIYGVRRRGIFDALRLPKGFTSDDARNDALTAYYAGLDGSGPVVSTPPPQYFEPPQANLFGVAGQTIDAFIAYNQFAPVGTGIGGIWNSGSYTIIIDRISFGTDGAGTGVGIVKSSDFLSTNAETAQDAWISHKERASQLRKDGTRRTGIFRSTENNYVAPAGAETPFLSFSGASTGYTPAYLNNGKDDLRVPPNTGVYVRSASGFRAQWEWREFNYEPPVR